MFLLSACRHLQWSELPGQAGKWQSIDFKWPSSFWVSIWGYVVPSQGGAPVSKVWPRLCPCPCLLPRLLELPPPQGRDDRKGGWWDAWRNYAPRRVFPSSHSLTAPTEARSPEREAFPFTTVCMLSAWKQRYPLLLCPCVVLLHHDVRWPSSSAITESGASWRYEHYKFYYYIWNFMICLTTG